MRPRLPVRPPQQAVGFFIADDLLFLGVPRQSAAELNGEIRQNAARGRDVAFLDVGDGSPARGDFVQKVLHMPSDGWSNVLFLICLKEGQESESWQRAVQTVDDLLESVSAVDSLADRARLLRMLPTLRLARSADQHPARHSRRIDGFDRKSSKSVS